MLMNIYSNLANLPDSSLENQLSKYFHKELSDTKVFELLKPLLLNDNFKIRKSGLRLIKRVIRSEPVLLEVLLLGLKKNNPSEFRGWLDAVYARLGPKKIVSYLISLIPQNVEIVDTAMYQLRALLLNDKQKVKTRIIELEELLKNYKRYDSKTIH